MRFVWLALLAGACRFAPIPADRTGDARPVDDAHDAADASDPGDAADAGDSGTVDADPRCFGVAPFTACLPQLPQTDLALDDPVTIDTGNGSDGRCEQNAGGRGAVIQVGAVTACAIAGTNVTIDANVTAQGELPLVIVATGDLTIAGDGYLYVGSDNGGNTGPAANSPLCSTTNVDGASAGGTGGGGAGGSFGSKGGDGGSSNTGATPGGTAAAAVTAPVAMLRGGCKGGDGGAGGAGPAPGGASGGAVYLVTPGTLVVAGTIDAAGAGGDGGLAAKGGAGGGGTGGMIVLAAGTLDVTGVVFANGAGGGGGADNNTSGGPGHDPTDYTLPAKGGPPGGPAGTSGGDGATGSQQATTPTGTGGGAGGAGGGGGVGVIRVLSGGTIPTSQVSPQPS